MKRFGRWMIRTGTTLATPEKWLVDWNNGGALASSGVYVNETTAMNLNAVYACVRVLAETIAFLPLPLYRRLPGGGKERAFDHSLYSVLHDAPNAEMTSFQFRETLMGHLCLWGNAYAEIERNNAGQVIGLWPLRPDRMKVYRDSNTKRILYEYRMLAGNTFYFSADQILHIRGLSNDGLIGYSPIQLAREAIGLGLATEEYGARFFSNDARPGGFMEHPGPKAMSDIAYKRLKEEFEKEHRGLTKAHRLAILEEGMKFHEVGIPPEAAQFLQTRKFQLAEVARIYRVPLHLVGDLERATFSNIEQQSLDFAIHSITPWAVRWEQQISMSLLAAKDRRVYFPEFLMAGLLRGDIQSRYNAYSVGRQNGWLSADDVRELENMNPLPDGQGKIYMVPLNMVPASTLANPPTPAPAAGTRSLDMVEQRATRAATSRRRLAASFKPLFRATEEKIVKREEADITRAAEKLLGRRDAKQFNSWLDEFYQDHQEFMKRTWRPVYATYSDTMQAEAAQEIGASVGMSAAMDQFMAEYLDAHVALHAESSLGQLRQVMEQAMAEGKELVPAIVERLAEWKERRPEKIALAETVQASNAVARETYRENGIRRTRWVAFNPNCPYCSKLNGRVMGIDETYLAAGTDFQPEGADRPLNTTVDVRHAPAHGGCDCQITAAQ